MSTATKFSLHFPCPHFLLPSPQDWERKLQKLHSVFNAQKTYFILPRVLGMVDWISIIPGTARYFA
jgi:hypothetical protein